MTYQAYIIDKLIHLKRQLDELGDSYEHLKYMYEPDYLTLLKIIKDLDTV